MLGMSRVISGIPSPTKVVSMALSGDTGQVWDDAEVVTLTLTFDAAVTVTGTPQIALDLDGTAQQCTYASGTGTTVLVFTYTVQSSDNAPAGTFNFTRSIDLNGGTLQTAGLDINPSLIHVALNTAGYAVSAAPLMTNVAFAYSATRTQGLWTVQPYIQTGDIIYVDVTYNKPITVVGNPYVTLNFGATTRTAAYSSGTGTATIRFAYTTVGTDTTYNTLNIAIDNAVFYRNTAITLNGGTMKDANLLSASTDLSAYIATGIDCNIPSTGSSAGGGAYVIRSGGGHLICSTFNHLQSEYATANTDAQAESGGGFSNWRLPNTSTEARDILANRSAIGSFVSNYYWTSIDGSGGYKWVYYSTTLNGVQKIPSDITINSRAVRVHGV